MGRKIKTRVPMPEDFGSDFERDDHILNYRPKIDFVLPPPELGPQGAKVEEPEKETIDSLRKRTADLIQGLQVANNLADLALKRIDDRVAADGGLRIHLDSLVDAPVISAIQRRFPELDPNYIDYHTYKKALDCLNKQAKPLPQITAADLQAAKADPLRTKFGGLDKLPGLNRPEVSSPLQVVEPIDLTEFQKNTILSLFEMLKNMIIDLIKSIVGIP